MDASTDSLPARFLAWLQRRLESEPALSHFFLGTVEVRTGDDRWRFSAHPRIVAHEGERPAWTALRVSAEDLLDMANGHVLSADVFAAGRLAWSGLKPEVELTLHLFRRLETDVASVAEYLERLSDVAFALQDAMPRPVRLDVDGAGTWTLAQATTFSEGGDEPFTAEIETSAEVLEALLADTLDVEAAFNDGRITIIGERADGPFLAFHPRASAGVIEGTVDPKDLVAGIRLSDGGGEPGMPVVVKSWFRFEVPPGEWILDAGAAGRRLREPVRVVVPDGGSAWVDVRLA